MESMLDVLVDIAQTYDPDPIDDDPEFPIIIEYECEEPAELYF